MKALLFYLTLSFGLLMQAHALAQDTDSVKAEPDDVRVKLNIDESENEKALSPDQQIERAVATIRKIAGDEIGENLALELNGLSDEEKKKLVSEISKFHSVDLSDMGMGQVFVAIVAIVFSLGMPIIILFMVFFFGHRKRRQKMEVMKAYLESGKEVPTQVLAEFTGEETNNFRSGVKLIAIGLGVILALTFSDNSEAAAFGLIPLFIGGARLLFWKFDNNDTV